MATETRDLKTILKELKLLQDEYKGKPMPTDIGETFEALAAEAKAIQDEADRRKRLESFERFAREIPDRTMPEGPQEKSQSGRERAGLITLGQAFVGSDAYKQYLASGMPQAPGARYAVKDVHRGVVEVTREMLERKEITIEDGVIRAERDTEIFRDDEEELTIRSLVQVNQTGSNLIDYLRYEYTRGAAPTAERAEKPQAAAAADVESTPVRTIAVWVPVTEQQIQDAPQLVGIIQGDLRWDLQVTEEEQMLWGDGTGENLLGIMETPGVDEARAEADDTLIDRVRRAFTDIRVGTRGRARPDGVLVHPYDWEEIVLEKGSDQRYVWAVVQDAEGLRIWGTRVVETVAAEHPETGQRVILPGAYRRSATLWDRQQAAVAFGWINDQFITNQRTIRAEERVAFAVRRPAGFRYIETQEAAGG